MILKIIATFILSVVILVNLIGGIKWIIEEKFAGDVIVLVGLTQTLNILFTIVIQIIWS